MKILENEMKRPGKVGFRIETWNIRSLYEPGVLKSISDAVNKIEECANNCFARDQIAKRKKHQNRRDDIIL